MAAALTIALTGFGAWSLDAAFKLTYFDWLLPAWLIAVAVVAVAALIVQRTRAKAPAEG
jgi:hypothetical protein